MTGDLRARILAEAKRVPAPTRKEHGRRVALLGGGGGVATILLFFAMGGVEPGKRPFAVVAIGAGVSLIAALALTRLASPARRSMLPRPAPIVIAACAVAAPLLVACAIVVAELWPGLASERVATSTDVACGLMTIAQGAFPLVVLLALRRAADPIDPMLTGAVLGMAAGAWAATMAYLRCPHVAASHTIVAHVVPAALFASLGALAARSLLRVR